MGHGPALNNFCQHVQVAETLRLARLWLGRQAPQAAGCPRGLEGQEGSLMWDQCQSLQES